MEALSDIKCWTDNNSSKKSNTLELMICNSEFIVSLFSLIDILKLTLPVSRILQSVSLDVESAKFVIEGVIEVLNEKRIDSQNVFKDIFIEACDMAATLGFEIKLPRLSNMQINRSNHPAQNAEEYYRRSIYIPLLDGVASDIKIRFSPDVIGAFDLRLLIPKIFVDKEKKSLITNIVKTLKLFSPILSSNHAADLHIQGRCSFINNLYK